MAAYETDMPKLYKKWKKHEDKVWAKVEKRVKCLADDTCQPGLKKRAKNAFRKWKRSKEQRKKDADEGEAADVSAAE